MKVEKSTVSKMVITGAIALDPIAVYVDDFRTRAGKITIECYGKSWSAYWGGCGDKGVAAFFISMDEHYLAKNLSDIRADIVDGDSIKDAAFRQIIAMRRGRMKRSRLSVDGYVRMGRGDITLEQARELWEEVEDTHFSDNGHAEANLMQRVFGDEWWYALPTRPNPDYQYLCRIIRAVQEAFNAEVTA